MRRFFCSVIIRPFFSRIGTVMTVYQTLFTALAAAFALAACNPQNAQTPTASDMAATENSDASSATEPPEETGASAVPPTAPPAVQPEKQTGSDALQTAVSDAAAMDNVKVSAVCEAYLKRTENCYAKAGKDAEDHARSTMVLKQTWAGATLSQQDEMCKMADEAFSETAKKLGCE